MFQQAKHNDDRILSRISCQCIVAAKSDRAKQRLVEAAIELAGKERPTNIFTIALWIVLGFVIVWGCWELICLELAR